MKFVATKKGMTTNFCSPLSFVEVLGSGIRGPGSEIRDSGSGIRDPGWVKNQDPGIIIPDPQHWIFQRH